MNEEIIQGIYKIENTNTGKAYIGQSRDIYTRWNDHKSMLKNGTHPSKKLQMSYDLTEDKSIFEYSILEEVTNPDRMKIREQYYIEQYNSVYNGYNSVNNKISERAKVKDLKRIYYYDLFAELYLPDIIHFGRTWLEKLTNKNKMHYSDVTMRRICIILKWFYDNYDVYSGYTMEVSVLHNRDYNAFIYKEDIIVGRYFFGTDKSKKIYRPDSDLTGFSTGKKDSEKLEIKLSYEDCLKKWKPIDQLKNAGTK